MLEHTMPIEFAVNGVVQRVVDVELTWYYHSDLATLNELFEEGIYEVEDEEWDSWHLENWQWKESIYSVDGVALEKTMKVADIQGLLQCNFIPIDQVRYYKKS